MIITGYKVNIYKNNKIALHTSGTYLKDQKLSGLRVGI